MKEPLHRVARADTSRRSSSHRKSTLARQNRSQLMSPRNTSSPPQLTPATTSRCIPKTWQRPCRTVSVIEVLAEIGSAHVCPPATNAHLVCRLLLIKKTETKP